MEEPVTAAAAPPAATAQKPPVKKRQVVSGFILKEPLPGEDGKPMIALFRRSEKVSTYRNLLGAISGTIDPDDISPESAAWREMGEETCLGPSQLTLVRKGKPYTFGDTNLNREWTIHPFLFKLKHPSFAHKIRIDWEHTDFAWLDPMTVPEEDDRIVPRIAESLRRVFVARDLGVEAGSILESGLDNLRNDHVNGARVLAGTAVTTLTKIVETMDSDVAASRWWRNLRMAGWHLWRNGRPAMDAAIRAVVVEALSQIEDIIATSDIDTTTTNTKPLPTYLRSKMIATLKTYQGERDQAVTKIAQAFTSYLASLQPDKTTSPKHASNPISILTLSSSSTITAAITAAAAASISLHIRVLESRPLFEGAGAAAIFAALPHTTVTVYPDAGASYAARRADIVLLGADRISNTGAVSNKLGSLSVVLAARHMSKCGVGCSGSVGGGMKIVVLGEGEKVAAVEEGREEEEEENSAAEIADAWKGSGLASVRAAADAVEVKGGYDSSRASRDGGGGRVSVQGDGNGGGEVGTGVLVEGVGGPEQQKGVIQVRNLYFEWVKPEDDDLPWVYLSERGEWDVKAIAARAREVDELTERLFLDV